jgi:hypothetical protein
MRLKHKAISIPVQLLLILAYSQLNVGYLLAAGHVGYSGEQPIRSINANVRDELDGVGYLSETEREIVKEINLLRSDPPGYARLRLEPLRRDFHGNLLYLPERNSVPILTKEGIAALDECIRVLKNTSPLPPLKPSRGLTLAARDMAQLQGSTYNTGHIGPDGSTTLSRIERYGVWDTTISENISYGYFNAKYIVSSLLIDDDVPSRGHRTNLLNGGLNQVGVAAGPHRRYEAMCVMDFAAKYITQLP